MSDVNKAFLEYHDANDLGKKTTEDLAEIRAAFIAGYNHYTNLHKDLFDLIHELDAPGYGDLRPSADIVHDYYERIVSRLLG